MNKKFIDFLLWKGYKVYSEPLRLNIVGIRNSKHVLNAFNDRLIVFFNDPTGKFRSYEYTITTMPGKHWLKNPINSGGTAILVEGQYENVYKIDKHQSKYNALCQRNGEVRCYRDNDRDLVFDMDPKTITSGYYGINIHRANKNVITKFVDKNSAGCQVFADSKDFDSLMVMAQRHLEKHDNVFTYTLVRDTEWQAFMAGAPEPLPVLTPIEYLRKTA